MKMTRTFGDFEDIGRLGREEKNEVKIKLVFQ